MVTGGGLGIYSVASNVSLYSKGRHRHHGTVKNAVKHWRQQKFYIGYGTNITIVLSRSDTEPSRPPNESAQV